MAGRRPPEPPPRYYLPPNGPGKLNNKSTLLIYPARHGIGGSSRLISEFKSKSSLSRKSRCHMVAVVRVPAGNAGVG